MCPSKQNKKWTNSIMIYFLFFFFYKSHKKWNLNWLSFCQFSNNVMLFAFYYIYAEKNNRALELTRMFHFFLLFFLLLNWIELNWMRLRPLIRFYYNSNKEEFLKRNSSRSSSSRNNNEEKKVWNKISLPGILITHTHTNTPTAIFYVLLVVCDFFVVVVGCSRTDRFYLLSLSVFRFVVIVMRICFLSFFFFLQ